MVCRKCVHVCDTIPLVLWEIYPKCAPHSAPQGERSPIIIGLFHLEWCSGCNCDLQHVYLESQDTSRGRRGCFFFSFFFEGGGDAGRGARNKSTSLFDDKYRSIDGFFFEVVVTGREGGGEGGFLSFILEGGGEADGGAGNSNSLSDDREG